MPLMAVLAGEVEFVPESQKLKPSHSRTSFRIRFLSARQRALVMDKAHIAEATISLGMGSSRLERIRQGLVGWTNFMGRDRKPLVFAPLKDGVCPDENIDKLGDDLFIEMAEFIRQVNEIIEDEEKNSQSAAG